MYIHTYTHPPHNHTRTRTDTMLLNLPIFLLVKLLSLLKPSAPMHGAARHAHMVRAAAREAAAEMQKDGRWFRV